MKPMLTEDYLIRMINQAIAALATIAGLKKAGQHQEALQSIDQAVEQLLGLRAELVKQMDEQSLLAALTPGNKLDTRRLSLIAALFTEQGEVYAAMEKVAESKDSYQRALNFYLEVALGENVEAAQETPERIGFLVGNLVIADLPVDTRYALFLFYDQRGEYAQAEEALDELLAQADLKEAILPEAFSFYRNLLEQPESALRSGGMNRSHVQERLAWLEDQR